MTEGPWRHERITANGTTHHFVTAGDGPPLVLLHGFPQTWLQWRPMMERLAQQFRLIVPDLRGLGGTPGPASGYDKHSLASDVHAMVEAKCGAQPVLLCGHDMGAYVAFAYALSYRSGVNGLIMIDAPPPGTAYMDSLMHHPRTWHVAFHANADVAHMLISGHERAYLSFFIRSRLYDQGAISEEDIDRYAAAYSAPGALRAALEMYRALPIDAELNRRALTEGGKLEIPVIMLGSGVKAAGRELQGVVDEVATKGEVMTVERSGHWIPEEQPDQLATIITELAGRSVPGS